jgi:hypothetical protein
VGGILFALCGEDGEAGVEDTLGGEEDAGEEDEVFISFLLFGTINCFGMKINVYQTSVYC